MSVSAGELSSRPAPLRAQRRSVLVQAQTSDLSARPGTLTRSGILERRLIETPETQTTPFPV